LRVFKLNFKFVNLNSRVTRRNLQKPGIFSKNGKKAGRTLAKNRAFALKIDKNGKKTGQNYRKPGKCPVFRVFWSPCSTVHYSTL
jgi:hypothetical protein